MIGFGVCGKCGGSRIKIERFSNIAVRSEVATCLDCGHVISKKEEKVKAR